VLRIFKSKRKDVREEWRRLRKGELNDVYISPHIIRRNKSRIRWAGKLARMWELHAGFWWGNLRERGYSEDTGVDGGIILGRIFRMWDGVMDWLRIGQLAGFCECGNEPSVFRKCGEFLD
jgi:hypothetical protein